jgi:urease accessory protein
MIVTSIVARVEELEPSLAIDTLELASEERSSPHFSAETAGGRHIRVSLPRGTELQDGDVLAVDDKLAIVVKAKDEDVFFLRPGEDPVLWWGACYQLGNFHRPARFTPSGVLTPADPLVAQLLERLGIAFTQTRAPFVGRRFGAAGAHHHHHPDSHGEADRDGSNAPDHQH